MNAELARVLPILLLFSCLTAYGQVIPPSGDKTGKTDGAAINSALSSSLSAQLACNSQYYTDVTIQVPAGASFVGCGYSSKIAGVGTITGGIIQLLPPSLDQIATQLVGNFQITAGTATEAVLAGGAQNVGPYTGVHMSNIWVTGGTYTNVFWFNTFFNNQVDNLITTVTLGNSLTVSAACFHFDGQVNADIFNNLSATCGAPYGFYMQNTQESSASSGDTFNTLNAEGGCNSKGTSATCAGLYVGGGFSSLTFNSLYTENVLHPIVLGNASTNDQCLSVTFNSPTLGGPSVASANQLALVDIDDCGAVTFNSPEFFTNDIGTAASLTFSGGGCATEPTGIGIPNPAGVLRAVTLIYPGAGCTSAPTVVVGGAGTGASVTAAESGGVVTGLTIAAGGSGYTLQGIVPVAYNFIPRPVTVIAPFCNDGAFGNNAGCWAWTVRASGASGGVNFQDDLFPTGSGAFTANLQYTWSGNQHYVQYLDASGATHTLSVVPQVYP